MDLNEKFPETNVPRFLDDVQIVERKRLRMDSLGKHRWSLSERRQDTQSLAEMGVALLDDCQSPVATSTSTDTKENLENRSPNLRSPHSLKRQHSKASPNTKNNSPNSNIWKKSENRQEKAYSKYSDIEDVAKSNRISNNCVGESSPKSNKQEIKQNAEIGKFNSNCASSLQGNANIIQSNEIAIELIPRSGKSCLDRVEDPNSSLEDLDCSEKQFDDINKMSFSADRKRSGTEEFKGKDTSKRPRGNESGTEAAVNSTDMISSQLLQSDISLTSVSPRPTCLAHPELHTRLPYSSIPRHTTFDDDVLNEDKFGPDKPSTSTNEDRTTLEQIESMSHNTNNRSRLAKESQLTSVDRVIFESASNDLDQTMTVDECDRFYYKPEDTVLENVATSQSNDEFNLKCINIENNKIKNRQHSNNANLNISKSDNELKYHDKTLSNELVDESTEKISRNDNCNGLKSDLKSDCNNTSRKRGSGKQSSLKAYFVVENEKKSNNKKKCFNKETNNENSTNSRSGKNIEENVLNIEIVSNKCEPEKNINRDSSFKDDSEKFTTNVESSVCAAEILTLSMIKNTNNSIDDEEMQNITPSKSIPNLGYSNQTSTSSTCEACGDKEKCCGSHSKINTNINGSDGGMFAKLSDEVVLSILQWLPKRTIVRCMLVSRRWRRLGGDSRLWARVDLGGRVLPSGALPILMGRHPVALRLANAQLTSPVIPQPSTSTDRLEDMSWRIQYLDLSAAFVSSDCLGAILRASHGLIRLSLEGLVLGMDAANALLKLTKVKSLNLALTTDIGPALLSKYHQNTSSENSLWPKCESLNVAWCNLETEELNALCEMLPPALQRLNISGCRKSMTDAVVAKIVARCPDLVELDLSDSAMLTSESVRLILTLTSLEHLALSRCYRLVLQDYIDLSGCASLQWLDAFGTLPNLCALKLQRSLPSLHINKFIHSSVARPTVGNRRTSIWGLRTRD